MNNKELNDEIFKRIAKLGNYSSFTPKEVSIGWIPFPVRNRNLFSHLDILDLIVNGLSEKIRKLNVDGLIGAATAGIPLAMVLSQRTKIPFGYVRKEARNRADCRYTEGDFHAGQKVALVDDLMGSANTKKLLIKNLASEELITEAIVIIWVDISEECQQAIKKFEDKGIKIISLFNWIDLLNGLYKYKFIPEKLYPLYLDFLQHRENWTGKDKTKWFEYLEVLHQLKIDVPEKFQDWLEA